MWQPQQGDEDIVDDDVGVVGVGVGDDNSDPSHPEQPVGEDEGVDGVAGLAVPHLQYLCSVYKLLCQTFKFNRKCKIFIDYITLSKSLLHHSYLHLHPIR